MPIRYMISAFSGSDSQNIEIYSKGLFELIPHQKIIGIKFQLIILRRRLRHAGQNKQNKQSRCDQFLHIPISTPEQLIILSTSG